MIKRWYQDSKTLSGVARMLLTAAGRSDILEDSGETALFERQLKYVITKLYEIKYPDLKARLFIPVDTSVPPGAESFVWRAYDWAGMARIISDMATDLPTVEIVGGEVSQICKTLGVSYKYSVQDILAAALTGVQINDEKARAARKANENALEQLAALGNADANLPGFLNNANVDVLTLSGFNGDWRNPSTTGAEILDDLNMIATECFKPHFGYLAP
jgi:hypothetical protein